MSWLTPEFFVQLVVMLAGAGAVYGGIRADIRNLHTLTDRNARATARAHERIDALLERQSSS